MNNMMKYRAELMGVAMLLVMMFHARFEFPAGVAQLYRLLKPLAIPSVDVFFLLSGIGLVYSMGRKAPLHLYFRKRFSRLLPPYYLYIAAGSLLAASAGVFSWSKTLLAIFGLDFLWLGDQTAWFVPAILVCYLIFPLLYYAMQRWSAIGTFAMAAIGFTFLNLALADSRFQHLLLFTTRLPVFALGALVAWLHIRRGEQQRFPWLDSVRWHGVWLVLMAVVLLAVFASIDKETARRTGIVWYITALMGYSAALVGAALLRRLAGRGAPVLASLRFIGTYSLELYLMHTLVFFMGAALLQPYVGYFFWRLPEYLAYMGVSVLLAYGVAQLTRRWRV